MTDFIDTHISSCKSRASSQPKWYMRHKPYYVLIFLFTRTLSTKCEHHIQKKVEQLIGELSHLSYRVCRPLHRACSGTQMQRGLAKCQIDGKILALTRAFIPIK